MYITNPTTEDIIYPKLFIPNKSTNLYEVIFLIHFENVNIIPSEQFGNSEIAQNADKGHSGKYSDEDSQKSQQFRYSVAIFDEQKCDKSKNQKCIVRTV